MPWQAVVIGACLALVCWAGYLLGRSDDPRRRERRMLARLEIEEATLDEEEATAEREEGGSFRA